MDANFSTGTAYVVGPARSMCPGHGPMRETYYCDGRCQRPIHARNRVASPASTALLSVLRYHAPWAYASFAAENMEPEQFDAVLADARAKSLIAGDKTTHAGIEVIIGSERSDADALRDTANHHQGSRVHAADADHGRQLRRQGLVGPRGGLTRRGSIAAERLRNAALDDAFGPL